MMETTELKRTAVCEQGIIGALYVLESATRPLPGVIVLGGSEGGVPDRAAARLASEGFTALALAYFGVDSLPRHPIEIRLEYFAHAIDWLTGRDEVDGNRVGLLGRSRGGELALLLGATYPASIQAVAAYVASGVVWPAPPSGPESMRNGIRSPWSLNGEPLPFLPTAKPTPAEIAGLLDYMRGKPMELRPLFERALNQHEELDRAGIEVEKIDGPVLLVSAGDDRLWPSKQLAEMVVARLERYNHPFPHRHLHYEEAGHLIGVPDSINRAPDGTVGGSLMGGNAEADEAASRESWPLVVAFLREALGELDPNPDDR